MASKDLYKNTPYFKKFPFVNYGGKTGINLMKRVDINANVSKFYSAFYTYTMQRNETMEELAFNYYQDVDLDWIIYHTNDVIDPYYDTTLTDEKFRLYIIKKYGSEQVAKTNIKHYKNNWQGDDRILSSQVYDATTTNFNPVIDQIYTNDGSNPDLIGNIKKYWQPVTGNNGQILGYKRNQINTIITTNRIETYRYLAGTGTFIKGERIRVSNDGTQKATFVSITDDLQIILQDIDGDFCRNVNFEITGLQSGATGTVRAFDLNATDEQLNLIRNLAPPDGPLIRNVIPAIEQQYYSPVTLYEWEVEQNEKNRDIYMVDESYKFDVNDAMTEALQ